MNFIAGSGRLEDRRVLYLGIHDRGYPRNRTIRCELESAGYVVDEAEFDIARGFMAECFRHVRLAWSLYRRSSRYSLVVLGEFSLQLVIPAAAVARAVRAPLVVDRFIGLYETRVSDWRSTRPWSCRALAYRFIDYGAGYLADCILIDTEMRARQLRGKVGSSKQILAVPVGAPAWAVPSGKTIERTGPTRILYYGNYIPLHGLEVLIPMLGNLSSRVSYELTMIGDGASRPEIEKLVAQYAMNDITEFIDPVPEAELISHIRSSDLVVGTFGHSPKAKSVVANKVWQGVCAGVPVITRSSEAYFDWPAAARAMLFEVTSESALQSAVASCRAVSDEQRSAAFDSLQEFCRHHYSQLISAMHELESAL
ncbi:MAG: hypothetical protein CME34_06965 [Gordonia sp.]|uniref:glycosyltransferase n=1 Tax=Gordonia sp. (in: high G+C Gram-positive bacteria) TaxID=84139 RepID=UPI000C63318F|nr:hypothetical protein [Gordonia sp. (in: high G+C Gram-positive bacteria)]